MSGLPIPEIARRAGKDPRTIRRWCALGIVSGAYQTKGGHWRVNGDNAATVARAASLAASGFARKRKENAFPPGYENSGLTPLQARVECGEMGFLLTRYKKVIWASGRAYPIDTKNQKIVFLNAFFKSEVESWHDGAESFLNKYAIRTGELAEVPAKLRYWTPKRIASLVGWSARSLYRHFPDWRRLLRKRALKCYRMVMEGNQAVPGETWNQSDRDAFAYMIDAALQRNENLTA